MYVLVDFRLSYIQLGIGPYKETNLIFVNKNILKNEYFLDDHIFYLQKKLRINKNTHTRIQIRSLKNLKPILEILRYLFTHFNILKIDYHDFFRKISSSFFLIIIFQNLYAQISIQKTSFPYKNLMMQIEKSPQALRNYHSKESYLKSNWIHLFKDFYMIPINPQYEDLIQDYLLILKTPYSLEMNIKGIQKNIKKHYLKCNSLFYFKIQKESKVLLIRGYQGNFLLFPWDSYPEKNCNNEHTFLDFIR
jgi:hypothetical protein